MVEAKVTLVDGMQFVGEATSNHSIVMDGDSEVGGHNSGFRPMELLLLGFGGCSGMDVISILRKKKQQVSGLEINVKGKRSDEHPKVYTDIEIEFIVKGTDISEDAVKKSVELSLDKYCSVGAILGKGAKIVSGYKII